MTEDRDGYRLASDGNWYPLSAWDVTSAPLPPPAPKPRSNWATLWTACVHLFHLTMTFLTCGLWLLVWGAHGGMRSGMRRNREARKQAVYQQNLAYYHHAQNQRRDN